MSAPPSRPDRPRRPPISTVSSSDNSSHSSSSQYQSPSKSHLLPSVGFPSPLDLSSAETYSSASFSSSCQPTMSKQHAATMAMLYTYPDIAEDDDWLHNPSVEPPSSLLSSSLCCCKISCLGLCNLLTLTFLASAMLLLFAGYPMLRAFLLEPQFKSFHSKATGFGLGGTNGTGQVPALPDLAQLVDPETPTSAHKWKDPLSGDGFHVVFSDEFNTDGRTFWPGDDPFWEAMDLQYWVTGDYEWYSPEAVNTSHGFLNLWMTEKETHNLNFQSGMLQSWNKFCFQGGYIETSVILPGAHDVEGFWPAVWMLGNLGRAGYAGTTQGMWPYSYNKCDVGTLANQTNPQKTAPEAAINAHGLFSDAVDNKISFLEGQRVSACTCAGEDHPGPRNDVGRSSPEIDIFETQNLKGHGSASQSFQIAPFDANYTWNQAPSVAQLHSRDTQFNTYTGGIYQEAVSGITVVPDTAYMDSGAKPVTMGVKWEPDWNEDGNGSITWFMDGKPTWSLSGEALGPNPYTEIGQRLIPVEPVSIVINLALSDGFQKIMWNQVQFPAVMKLDYIRVYQRDGQEDRITCDPKDHPTKKYIDDHIDVYMNHNVTVWPKDKYAWPKNKFIGEC